MSHFIAHRRALGLGRRPTASGGSAARRRRLDQLRRRLKAFESRNRYQAQLKGTTLAMIAYMRDFWCGSEHLDHFERWWPIVTRYARVLLSGTLHGPGTCKRLKRLLGQNQMRPSEL